MFALLGSLVGFLSSLAPDIFSMVKDRKDKEHELAILDKQMAFKEKGHHNRIRACHQISQITLEAM